MADNKKSFVELLAKYIAEQCDADNQKRSKLITVAEVSQAYTSFVLPNEK